MILNGFEPDSLVRSCDPSWDHWIFDDFPHMSLLNVPEALSFQAPLSFRPFFLSGPFPFQADIPFKLTSLPSWPRSPGLLAQFYDLVLTDSIIIMAVTLHGWGLAWLGLVGGLGKRSPENLPRKQIVDRLRVLGPMRLPPKHQQTGHWSTGTDWNLRLIPEILGNPDYLRMFNLEISSKYRAGSFLRT